MHLNSKKENLKWLEICPKLIICGNHIIRWQNSKFFSKNSKIEIIMEIENTISKRHPKIDKTLF